MTVDEATKRLADLAIEIERHNTAIWLAERERDEIRTEMRRAVNSSSSAGPSGLADQPTRRSEVPGSSPNDRRSL